MGNKAKKWKGTSRYYSLQQKHMMEVVKNRKLGLENAGTATNPDITVNQPSTSAVPQEGQNIKLGLENAGTATNPDITVNQPTTSAVPQGGQYHQLEIVAPFNIDYYISQTSTSSLPANAQDSYPAGDSLPSPSVLDADNINKENVPTDKVQPYLPVRGRRIVDLMHVFERLKDISNHNTQANCGILYLTLLGEKRQGLVSEFKFKCELCDAMFLVNSDGENEIGDTNIMAVRGLMATKITHEKFNTVMNCMEVPAFTKDYFVKVQARAIEVNKAAGIRRKLAALAAKERKKTVDAGFVDVIAEGIWDAKRMKKDTAAATSSKPKKKKVAPPAPQPKIPVPRTDPEERRRRRALSEERKKQLTETHAEEKRRAAEETTAHETSALVPNADPVDAPPIEFCTTGAGPSNDGQRINENTVGIGFPLLLYDESQELLTVIKEEPP